MIRIEVFLYALYWFIVKRLSPENRLSKKQGDAILLVGYTRFPVTDLRREYIWANRSVSA